MNSDELITLLRDVEASIVPVGDKVTLHKGEQARVTQSLGGSYTVVVNGNMFRIDSQNGDALGFEVGPAKVSTGSTGRRLAYAQWLTNGRHPLVSRVLVNRFWLNHIGRGIVNTPGDFGRQGELPTHPELLDWLADEFVKGGWKLKPLHRLIVLSNTYRQSSANEASVRADPENRLYARFKMKRLDAETLRDSMLATTGSLIETPYGAPSGIGRDPAGRIIVGKDKGTITSAKVESGGKEDFRRSIYVQVRRSMPLSMLEPFDMATVAPNCDRRSSSTVARRERHLREARQHLRRFAATPSAIRLKVVPVGP